MPFDCIVVRYGEINLKGRNRISFERKLISNIKNYLDRHEHPFTGIERLRNRIVIHTKQECRDLSRVFGIVSYSHATETKPVLEEIASAATVLATGFSARTRFRVTTKRMDKGFALTSMQVDRLIGELVAQGTGARVSLERFDAEIGIEILKHNAFVFSDRNCGFGGLPLGISGKAVALIEDVNGIVASWLMMKRGVVVYPVSLKPTDISVLQKYSYGCNISLRTIGTLREVESYMEQIDARALVVGQTLDKFSALPIQKMVVRPLVGYGSKEILELYGKIE